LTTQTANQATIS